MGSTSRTSPVPGSSAGPTNTRTRWPPHVGSNRWSGRVERVGPRDRPHRRDRARSRERRIEPEGELLGGHRGSMVARPFHGDRLATTGRALDPGVATRTGPPARSPARSPHPSHPEEPVPRSARPDDLYRLAVPSEPRLTPDGSRVVFTVKRSAVGKDGYRQALWSAPVDGSEPARQLTLGVRSDRAPQVSPDGSTVAFISDRRLYAEEEPDRPKDAKERDDCFQVFLLPLDGGEARRLTDLPKGVTRVRVVAGRPDARHPHVVARGDDRGGPPEARPARHAEAGRDAAVRLPVHRPPELPVQRLRVRRRQGPAPVARGRRVRRRAAARGRDDARAAALVVPGRHADRVRGQPSPEPGPRGATGDLGGGGRHRRGHAARARRRRDLRPADLDDATAPRSSHSGTSGRGPATGRGSGGSRPTAPTRRRAAARTCSPGASSSRMPR